MSFRGSRSTLLEKRRDKASLPFQSRLTINVTDWLVWVPTEQLNTHQIPFTSSHFWSRILTQCWRSLALNPTSLMSLAHNWRAVVRNVCPTLKRVFTAFLLPDRLRIERLPLELIAENVGDNRLDASNVDPWMSCELKFPIVKMFCSRIGIRRSHEGSPYSIRGSMGNRDRSPGSLVDQKFPSLARQHQQVKKPHLDLRNADSGGTVT